MKGACDGVQVAAQLQALLAEKARLASENARLAHENSSLQVRKAMYKAVACIHNVAVRGIAWPAAPQRGIVQRTSTALQPRPVFSYSVCCSSAEMRSRQQMQSDMQTAAAIACWPGIFPSVLSTALPKAVRPCTGSVHVNTNEQLLYD